MQSSQKDEPSTKLKRSASANREADAKLGTKKRKVKRRNSEASESESLIREAGLSNNKESYIYGSDVSTSNENETLDEYVNDYNNRDPTDNPDEDHPSKITVPANNMQAEGASSDSGNSEDRSRPSSRIKLPLSLKKVMITTFENISQNLVFDLPSCMSVRKVLGLYVDAKVYQATSEFGNRGSQEQERLNKRRIGLKGLAEGIAVFFEKAVKSRLLYPQELPQLNSFLNRPGGTRLSDIYGCEHLLRLLLILPDILSECQMGDKASAVLQDVSELVKFLHRQQDYLFVASFRRLTDSELDEIRQQQN